MKYPKAIYEFINWKTYYLKYDLDLLKRRIFTYIEDNIYYKIFKYYP